MTLEEAIKHAEEIAEEKREQANFDTDNERYRMSESERAECLKCAEEHKQLAEWLKELKALRQERPHGEWIEDIRSMICKVNDYYGYTDSMHMFKVLFDQKYHGWVKGGDEE